MYRKYILSAITLAYCVTVMAQHHIVQQPLFYRTQVIYSISMPIANIDTRYDVNIAAAPLLNDTSTLQHRYCITYSTPDRPQQQLSCFTFDDSLYHHRKKVLFSDLTYTAILEALQQHNNDTLTHIALHPDTLYNGVMCQAITATRYNDVEVACHYLYLIDKATRHLILFRRENNPDMPTTQTVEAHYITNDTLQYDFDQWVKLHDSTTYTNH